ncbi:MAG: FG-GAP-like repeat-containing protein, partial [Bacteroidota bacterium]
MKILLSTFLTIFSLSIWAQSFTPHFSDFPLRQIWKGKIQFADLNGDGYPDIFMTGRQDKLSGGYENVIDLYLNDGTGRFPHRQSLFGTPNLHEHFELADLDGDNDLDLVLGNAYPESPIKWNDGTG